MWRRASDRRLARASRSARRDKQRVSGSRSVISGEQTAPLEARRGRAPGSSSTTSGLAKIIVGARVEGGDATGEVGAPSEKEDGYVAVLGNGAHDPDGVPPAHARHHRVEKHEVGADLVEQLHESCRFTRRADSDPLALEHLGRTASTNSGSSSMREHAHSVLPALPEGKHVIDRSAESVGIDRLGQEQGGPGVRGGNPLFDVVASADRNARGKAVVTRTAWYAARGASVSSAAIHERGIDDRRIQACTMSLRKRFGGAGDRDYGKQLLPSSCSRLSAHNGGIRVHDQHARTRSVSGAPAAASAQSITWRTSGCTNGARWMPASGDRRLCRGLLAAQGRQDPWDRRPRPQPTRVRNELRHFVHDA